MTDREVLLRRYLAEGPHLPVRPGEKATQYPNWSDPDLRPGEDAFPAGVNIARRLDDLVDVDNDASETRLLAPKFLLKTGRIHGRPSLGPSHYWFRAPGSRYEMFKDVDGTCLVEIRAGNTHYTLIPPSVVMTKGDNPQPETLRWFADGEPGHVDAAGLRDAVRALATAALLSRRWPRGSRHDCAGLVAGFLAGRGLDAKTIEEIVRAAAEAAGDDEVEDRARYARDTAAKFAKGDAPVAGGPQLAHVLGDDVVKRLRAWYGGDAETFPLTEVGDAEMFAARHGDRVRFDHRRGLWLVFSDHAWLADPTEQLRGLAVETVRERQRQANEITDKQRKKEAWHWAFKGESTQRLNHLLREAKALPPIADRGDGWDTDPMLLGVRNGVLDLRTGQLRPGRPDDRVTRQAGIDFDPTAHSDLWVNTLREVFLCDEELIAYVQRALGYSLTGDTRFDCWFFCYGGGRNGKGTLLGAARAAIGDYAHELPGSALDLSQRDKIPADIAQLPGKRFVTSAETGSAIRLNHDRIKQLTGGDPVRARDFYERFFEFTPACKLWLAGNDKPRVSDDSEGFWARVRLIPLMASFLGREDQTIRTALERDPDHRRAVLAWMVQGCLAWQREGLNAPAVVRSATDAYRHENQPLTPFIDSCCVVREDARVQASDLFRAYQRWAEDNGIASWDRLNLTVFGREVKRRFPGKRIADNVWYLGVGLLQGATKEIQF